MTNDPTYEAVLKRCADALIPKNIPLEQITERLERLIEIYEEIELSAVLNLEPPQMQLTMREHLYDILLASCGIFPKEKVGLN